MAEMAAAQPGIGQRKNRRVVLGWALFGLAAFVLLPWYFPQNLTLWKSLPGVFGGAETAGGLTQALRHQKPWLWSGAAGLLLALAAARLPAGRAQGRLLLAGAGIGLIGLLASGFIADPAELSAVRRQQELIANTGWKTMTPIELFESNSQFHETLAKWSGNRFILQAVRRTDQLRRLVEYRQARSREPRQTQAKEHLEILDAIAAHDALKAASLMRAHLEGARRGKVYGGEAFVAPAPP